MPDCNALAYRNENNNIWSKTLISCTIGYSLKNIGQKFNREPLFLRGEAHIEKNVPFFAGKQFPMSKF